MAGNENSGGYRQPMNPAPVSPPGALSKRTDGGAIDGMTQPAQRYAGFGYGENLALEEQQAGAPMAGTGGMPNMPSFADIVPLGAPTMRPDEPLTAGLNIGEGPGREAMRGLVPNRAPSLVDTIKHLVQFDPSGDAELIYRTLTDQGY
jgi:hypothetical protein